MSRCSVIIMSSKGNVSLDVYMNLEFYSSGKINEAHSSPLVLLAHINGAVNHGKRPFLFFLLVCLFGWLAGCLFVPCSCRISSSMAKWMFLWLQKPNFKLRAKSLGNTWIKISLTIGREYIFWLFYVFWYSANSI